MYGSQAASIAAAQKRREELAAQEHEEEMTDYNNADLDNYEFKIVRANGSKFRDPEIFQQLLAEEALAGWELLEKLDDKRVRFKRNKDARRKDALLPQDVDPYRTRFGRSISTGIIVLAAFVALLSIAVFIGMILLILPQADFALDSLSNIPVIMVIVGVLTIIAGVTKIAIRR